MTEYKYVMYQRSEDEYFEVVFQTNDEGEWFAAFDDASVDMLMAEVGYRREDS